MDLLNDDTEEVLDLSLPHKNNVEPSDEEGSDEEDKFDESLSIKEELEEDGEVEGLLFDPLEYLQVDQKSDDGSSCETEEDLSDLRSNSKDSDSSDYKNKSQPETLKTSLITCKKCGCLKSVVTDDLGSDGQECEKESKETIQVVCDCENSTVKCKMCKKVLKQLDYESHIRNHLQSRKHRCETCGKCFLHAAHLRNHAASHDSNKTHFCDICSKSFQHFRSLKKHRVTCKDKKKFYKCDDCGESFPLKRLFFNHIRKHEKVKVPGESLTCEICCISFDNSSLMRDHIVEIHVAAQRFICEMCGEAFATESAKRRHSTTHLRNYPCKVCDRIFVTKREYLAHRSFHQTLGEMKCKHCGKQFEQESAFIEHKISKPCVEKKVFVCEQCQKEFHSKTSLKKHLIIHTPISERAITCEICGKSFSGNAALQKHIRLFHENLRPYICEFCSKSFNQLCKLKNHIVTHSKDKPVNCEVCNKPFGNEKDIKIHMRVHTGEKPFSCKLCGKAFRQRGHVKSHMVVHTKEKPYSCIFCNKTFGLSSSLKKHIKLHTTNVTITTK